MPSGDGSIFFLASMDHCGAKKKPTVVENTILMLDGVHRIVARILFIHPKVAHKDN